MDKCNLSQAKPVYHDWKKTVPPINTWVWSKYRENDTPQLVKTCANGCCVYSSMGCMVLPAFWYLASIEEGATEQDKWNNQPNIEMFDLYEEE